MLKYDRRETEKCLITARYLLLLAKGFKNKKIARGKKRTEAFDTSILILEQCENIRTKKNLVRLKNLFS